MKKISSLLLALMLMVSGVTFAQDKAAPKTKPATAQTSKPADKSATAGHTKKDGTPDKRYKENKKMKKDGTPDMRYKENKKATPAAK